jgi:hypothetical protein
VASSPNLLRFDSNNTVGIRIDEGVGGAKDSGNFWHMARCPLVALETLA